MTLFSLNFIVLLTCVLLSVQQNIFIGEIPYPNVMQCSHASKLLREKKETVGGREQVEIFLPFPSFSLCSVILFWMAKG